MVVIMHVCHYSWLVVCPPSVLLSACTLHLVMAVPSLLPLYLVRTSEVDFFKRIHQYSKCIHTCLPLLPPAARLGKDLQALPTFLCVEDDLGRRNFNILYLAARSSLLSLPGPQLPSRSGAREQVG